MRRRCMPFPVVAALMLMCLILVACQPMLLTPAVSPTPNPAVQNKAIARRVLEEAANQRNLDLLDELLAADYVLHDPSNPMVQDRETYKQFLGGHFTAFPDAKWTIDDLVAEGDRVVVRWTLSGTHEGPLMGIPPTNKSFAMSGISIYRLADGKIAEEWAVADVMGFMQQLGLLPAPGGPPPPAGGG
ncbi:MAG: ester cyclase [Caldilineae bacterium]|nr:MAG: ester cyclase [Caldilineae bacterium]